MRSNTIIIIQHGVLIVSQIQIKIKTLNLAFKLQLQNTELRIKQLTVVAKPLFIHLYAVSTYVGSLAQAILKYSD